jgi:hypothetical protein
MKITLITLLLISTWFLSACQAVPGLGPQPSPTSLTPVPVTPTPSLATYRQDPSGACRIADLKSIGTTADQGILAAWSPAGDKIAYIAPVDAHSMFSGNLMVASAPDFSTPLQLGKGAYGGVTWSPGGDQVAYVTLRPVDNIYTVIVAHLDNSPSVDLFPGKEARIDDWSSPKTVLSWPEEDQIHILAACGIGCLRELEVSVPDGQKVDLPTPDPQTPIAPLWTAPRNVIQYNAENYPVLNDPNWSRDGSRVAYFDKSGYLWVLLEKEKIATELQMDITAIPVYLKETWNRETHWTQDGKLAVRISGVLDIFDVPCHK